LSNFNNISVFLFRVTIIYQRYSIFSECVNQISGCQYPGLP